MIFKASSTWGKPRLLCARRLRGDRPMPMDMVIMDKVWKLASVPHLLVYQMPQMHTQPHFVFLHLQSSFRHWINGTKTWNTTIYDNQTQTFIACGQRNTKAKISKYEVRCKLKPLTCPFLPLNGFFEIIPHSNPPFSLPFLLPFFARYLLLVQLPVSLSLLYGGFYIRKMPN